MANAVPTRLGQADLSGSTTALFLKVFAGETLAAFRTTCKAAERTITRSIPHGISASFPASWKGTAAYHTPGAELVGTTVAQNERIITIDSLYVADRFIAKIDEAMNHFDMRSELAKDAGQALAQQYDKNLFQVLILAARATTTVVGGNGGTAITSATAKTNADALIQAIFDASTAMDQKDIPDVDRFVAITPVQYNLLVNSSSKLIHRDYNMNPNGSIASGVVMNVAGMEIVKTNNLPTTNINSGPTAYQGDFSNTAAVCWQKGAAGTVKLLDVATEAEWDIRRQGTLLLAKYAVGHGILRPECSVEIKTA